MAKRLSFYSYVLEMLQEADRNLALKSVVWEQTACPVCGSHDYVVDHVDRVNDPPVAIVGCPHCGLHFQNPRPTQDTVEALYPLNYECYEDCESKTRPPKSELEKSILYEEYSHPTPVGTLARRSFPVRVRQRFAFRRRCRRAEWIKYRGQGKLLDVGCGAGGFLSRMKYRGWNVEGLDITPEVCRRVSQRLGIPVHTGTLPNPALPTKGFDLVTFWQVLEHVPNPVEVLRDACRLLSLDGVIIATVPNYRSTSRRWFPDTWIGLDLPRHLIHFTPESICRTFAAAGLKVVRIHTMAMDGWVRASATCTEFSQARPWMARIMDWKPIVSCYGWLTERFESADTLLVEAVPVDSITNC